MRIFLAPMEGVVDHHLRYLLTRMGGIDLCVTEFVRVTSHTLPEKVFKRYSPELLAKRDPSHKAACCPTRVQLLGSNPEVLAANARKAAKMGAPGIDLNFGCPAKTVNKNRGGACLLREPETLHRIVGQVRQAVPAHIPVSAKIRLGFEDRSAYLDNARAITEAGANELIVHARSKVDGYRPPAYWHLIAHIVEAIDIPVVANGEIWNLEDYQRCVAASGCEDVMLGRGLLAMPDLALQIKHHTSGSEVKPTPWQNIAQYLLEFFDMTSSAYLKKYVGNRSKQWLFYLQRQYPEAERLFTEIKRSRDHDTIRQRLLEEIPKPDQLVSG